MDVVNLSVSEQSYHRIQPRPKSDVEFVPDKLFSYHRIQSRLKSDVEFVPGKLFHTIQYDDKPKRMEICADHNQTKRFQQAAGWLAKRPMHRRNGKNNRKNPHISWIFPIVPKWFKLIEI